MIKLPGAPLSNDYNSVKRALADQAAARTPRT